MDKKEFIEELKEEIKNLERLMEEMKSLLANLSEEPTFMEIRASASILHDFYSGIEKIFERIALIIDNHLPAGDVWHIELLSQMANPFRNIRQPVIGDPLFEKLKEYLKFRHLFRHTYGFELKWNRIKHLCFEMENVFDELRRDIYKFFNSINKWEG